MRRRAMMLESSDKSVLYEAYNLVFTGSNYIDTGIKLFSEENIGRDFELYADLVTGAGDTSSSVITCKKEGGATCGFVVRNDQKPASWAGNVMLYTNAATTITIRRVSGVYTLEGRVYASNFPPDNIAHDMPLVLGCALDANGNPYRYAYATINHIIVRWL